MARRIGALVVLLLGLYNTYPCHGADQFFFHKGRDALELIALDELRVWRVIIRPGCANIASFIDTNGTRFQGTVGTRIGKNQGMIIDITATYVAVHEFVHDGDEWRDREVHLIVEQE